MNLRIMNNCAIGGARHLMNLKDAYVFEIFFQGCLKKCKDCPDAHGKPMFGGTKIDTEVYKKMIAKETLIKGIFLNGAEPFLQPMAALDLIRFAKSRGLLVVCKTGYTFEQILEWEDNRKTMLENIDVLVDGCGDRVRTLDAKASLSRKEAVSYEQCY